MVAGLPSWTAYVRPVDAHLLLRRRFYYMIGLQLRLNMDGRIKSDKLDVHLHCIMLWS